MHNLKIKATILSLAMTFILSSPVMAQTKDYSYDLAVNGSATKYGATKAGGSSFEKKFYVTQNFVARLSGSTRYFSYHSRLNGERVSNGLKLSENNFKKHYNTYYSGKAIAGKKYKLYCKCTGSGSTSGVSTTVTGRWTP